MVEPSQSAELKLGIGDGQVGQIEKEGNGNGEKMDIGRVESLGMRTVICLDFWLDEQ